MIETIGPFEIEVWEDGYPIWTRITYNDITIGTIHHSELLDLEYAVKKAKKLAKNALPARYKKEVL